MFRAMYGAGTMPARSTSSPNVSGVHLNASLCGGSRLTTTNILPATQKHRSLPHFTSSVTAGSARQIERTVSSVIAGPQFIRILWQSTNDDRRQARVPRDARADNARDSPGAHRSRDLDRPNGD